MNQEVKKMTNKKFNEKKEKILEDLDKIKERIKNIVYYKKSPILYAFSGVEIDITFINNELDKIEGYMLVYPFREKRIKDFKLNEHLYERELELARIEGERVAKNKNATWNKHIKKPYEFDDERDKIFSWDLLLLEGEESGSEEK